MLNVRYQAKDARARHRTPDPKADPIPRTPDEKHQVLEIYSGPRMPYAKHTPELNLDFGPQTQRHTMGPECQMPNTKCQNQTMIPDLKPDPKHHMLDSRCRSQTLDPIT